MVRKDINKLNKKKKKNKKIFGIINNNVNIEDNVIRKIGIWLYDNLGLKNISKYYYYAIHNIFMCLVGIIVFFNNNEFYLMIVLIIISLDAISIVVCHKCPLTNLERKYLGSSSCDHRKEILKKLGILYNCDHDYENQIELVINVWLIIAVKCLVIIFIKTFKIKLIDYNNFYTG